MFLPAVDFQNFHMGIKFLSKKKENFRNKNVFNIYG